jgi:Ca-activated chloride channel family protein
MTRALLVFLLACGDGPAPAPTVATAHVIRGSFTLSREGEESVVRGNDRVETGASAATGADSRAGVRLDNGAFVLLDRSTTLKLELGKISLEGGRIWIDTTEAEETTVETPGGTLTATGATFAVEKTEDGARVYCGSGEVTYRSERGDGQLPQGETLVLGANEPAVEPAALWDDWTGGLADPTPRVQGGATYVGLLAGRRLDELGIARTVLPIRSHEVNTAIRGDLAITTVVQTFFNARSDVLEGEWNVRIPEGAIVQSFAVDDGNGSGFVDGTVGVMQNENGYGLSWADPSVSASRLTYDGPSRLRARIYPVQPGATVRIRLLYSEWLERRGDMRTYVYPMSSGTQAPSIAEFVLTVDTSAANAGAFRAGMGAETQGTNIVLRKPDFRPQADFYLDLVDGEDAEVPEASLYVASSGGAEGEGDQQYVLVDASTAGLEEREGDEPPLELALVVDASGGTDPESLELESRLVETVLRQLAPTDRVAVRVADVTAWTPEGIGSELLEATPENREAIVAAISRVQRSGATDLATSLRDAAELVVGKPRGAVLYLGDGLPTTGALDATAIERVLATIDAPPRYFAIGIGDGANMDLLRALFGEHAVQVRERTEASRAVMSLLAEAARPMLRGVTLDLGEGIERVYPRPPLLVEDGAHVRVVGRLIEDLPAEIAIRGTRDGEPFELKIPVTRGDVDDGGDIRRRWAQNRLNELLDGDAGREALVELGVRFGLVTPWTSFVIGSYQGNPYQAIRGFDYDPNEVAWDLGGRGAGYTIDDLGGGGWRRRMNREEPEIRAAVEETWVNRVDTAAIDESADRADDDGGLGMAAVRRALATSTRGPDGCYERKLMTRPDLAGEVSVSVSVDGTGSVREAKIDRSTMGAADLDDCVLTEVQGIRFPAAGGTNITVVNHTYYFRMPSRVMGMRRTCSAASSQILAVRRALWRERLANYGGVGGALEVWRMALDSCELEDWRARRTLLDMLIRHVGGVQQQIELYQSFGPSSDVADYLRRAILNNVRTPEDVVAVRQGLGLEAPVDWTYFAKIWRRTTDPEARLRLVRRWLEVIPDEMDLRLRLLALLEETQKLPEAKRLAHELRADPFADSRVRTAVGEFWLRQDDQREARRVFSEIVETAPLDPWARKRLGDLYRAHGWFDDAYREYTTLSRLRPADLGVLLDLSRAAAGAGRIDEALRLEQRLAEADEAGGEDGAPGFARLWTQVRLAHLKSDAPTELRDVVNERERATGVLRDPPAIFATITWAHPDDAPALFVRYPTEETDEELAWERAPRLGAEFGIEAALPRDRDEGDYLFEVRREERDQLRVIEGELMVIVSPGTAEERILRAPVRLNRETRKLRFRLTAANALDAAAIPARPEAPARAARPTRPAR